MEGHKSKGGVGLLELALGKMYHNPLVIYREYIQNACDGLKEALNNKLIREDERNIVISINHTRHQITFEDGGIGVPSSKIGETLVDIGNSQKSSELIGQYGIGRLIAARYCDRIIFETSYMGEPTMSRLIWDTNKAFQMIDNKEEPDFTKIIDAVTTHITYNEEADQHYFRVTLDNVYDFDLLDEDKIYDFIAQTAPVDFTFEFKDEMLKKALENNPEFKELMSREGTYRITLNKRDVRKLYQSKVNDIQLTEPEFFYIDDINFGHLAWGWYSLPINITEMNDSPFRGIRLRKSNMAIGLESILTEYFPKNVDAFHFVGELYIIHSQIEPSGSRDGIGVSNAATAFKYELNLKCKELHDLYTKVYRFGNDFLKKISQTYIEVSRDKIELKKVEDKEKKKELKAKIKRAETEIATKIKDMAAKREELATIEGSASLIEAFTTHNEAVHKEKINKHNGSKSKDKGTQIKEISISEISEEFKHQTENGENIDDVPSTPDPLDNLPKNTRNIIDVVKRVIDSEPALTDIMRESIMNKIIKKVSKK